MKRRVSLDLHGRSVEESVRELEQSLSDAIMAGAPQIEVIHGLGSGKVMRAVHKYLSKSPVVHAFKLDAGNPGVTIVYL